MKVSLNHIRQYLNFDLPPVDELVKRINEQLGGVEEVIDLHDKYKDAVIVRVVECEKHPNADKLSVCQVDVGEDSPYSKFYIPNSNHLVEVVCGAPNVHAGMWAIWLPPGATVPSSYGKDPFVLDVREIRGVKSHGMLAAADELAIGSDHVGIVELTDSDFSPLQGPSLQPGASFAKAFGLDDTIIDIENKMFTHRPDLFGQLGVAREIAGILGHRFKSPEWYLEAQNEEGRRKKEDELELEVFNDAKAVVPRFMAVAIRDVAVRPSPMWLQCELVRMGTKPINNIVDATNYIMLTTAQPTHAYDYDTLRSRPEQKEEGRRKKEEKVLGVRLAKKGELITLLNGKTYELDESDIVIVDGEGPVGLGGVMGGGNSEVSDDTTHIVLEVATFDMYAIRRTSMRHGLFTDAVSRFNKGQSPLQNEVVLRELMQLVTTIAGGEQAGEVCDIKQLEDGKWNMAVEIDEEFINARLGLQLHRSDVQNLLENVEFSIADQPSSNSHLPIANIPFWRTDIEQPEDIVEEVGRLHGFDKLHRELPRRSITPARNNELREVKTKIRDSLSRAGANEVLTYSFVHENVMRRAEQQVDQAFQLSNALSPDLQYYRLSILPSLLDRVHANVKSSYDEFVLFEIGKGHNKKYHGDDDNGLPAEMEFVDAVYTSKKPLSGAAYYRMRRMLDQLASDLGFKLTYAAITEPLDFPVTAPFDLERSALVHTSTGEFVGMIGELKSTVHRAFKLPDYTAAMTLDLDGLCKAHYAAGSTYIPLSRYPSVMQDISLKVASDVSYEQIFFCARDALKTSDDKALAVSVSPLSIYQSPDDTDHKTITLRIEITSYERTLTDGEVTTLLDTVAHHTADAFAAQRI